MPSVDNRIVNMEFNNSQFESGASQSMSTLEKLKKSLNFKGAEKSLDGITKAANSVSFAGIASGIDNISSKFSFLGNLQQTVFSRMSNAIVDFGKKLVTSVTIDPIKDGFEEYETQMKSIQTILANTSDQGTNLSQVTDALDELNTYADQTIYNFTEMTRNIGRFTAAGVDLDKSVAAIKGISNLAAVSGSTSAQASSAMYQLSQALAAGTVNLQDWNSVVNANMGGKVFQKSLERAGHMMGKLTDDEYKQLLDGSKKFRESISPKDWAWLDGDVLTEALTEISGAYNEAELKAKGYSDEEVKQITELADTALEAATKIRTFGQLVDTVKESLGSGWTNTWEQIIGNFDEATEKLSTIGDAITGFVSKTSQARIEMLKLWHDAGGYTTMWRGFENIFKSLKSVISPIKDAFESVFPPMTYHTLLRITNGFEAFTRSLILNEDQMNGVRTVATGVFQVLKIGVDVVKNIASIGAKAINIGLTGLRNVFGVVGKVKTAFDDMHESIKEGTKENFDFSGLKEKYGTATAVVVTGAEKMKTGFESVKDAFGRFASNVASSPAWSRFTSEASKIGGVIKTGFLNAFDKVKEVLGNVFSKLKEITGINFHIPSAEEVAKVFERILDAVSNLFQMLRTGKNPFTAFFDGLKNIKDTGIKGAFTNIIQDIKDFISGKGLNLDPSKSGPVVLLKSVKDKITDLAKGIDFKGITSSIGDGAKALFGKLKGLDWGSIVPQIINIAKLFASYKLINNAQKLVGSFDGLISGIGDLAVKGGKTLDAMKRSFNAKAIQSIAISVGILVGAMFVVAQIPADKLKTSAEAVVGAFASLVAATALLGNIKVDRSQMLSIAAMWAGIGVGLLSITGSLAILGHMEWSTIEQGAKALAIVLGEVSLAMRIAGKGLSVGGGLGFAAIGVGVAMLVPQIAILGHMEWDTIEQGAKALGVVLLELAGASRLAGNGGGFGKFVGMAAALAVACYELKTLADLDPDALKRSTEAICGVLVSIGGSLALSNINPGSAKQIVAMAVAIAAAAISLRVLSDLDMESLKTSAASLSGVLLSVAGSFAILDGIKFGSMMGQVLAMSLVIGAATAALYALQQVPDPSSILPTAEGLSAVVLSVGSMMAVLGGLHLNTGAILSASTGLSLAIAEITAVVGALADGLYGLSDLVKKTRGGDLLAEIQAGGEIMKAIAGALGDMIGAFAGGVVGSFTEYSTKGFDQAMTFINTIAQKFVQMNNTLKNIKGEELLANIGKLGGIITEITGLQIGGAIARFGNTGLFGKSKSEATFDALNNMIDPLAKISKKMESLNINEGAINKFKTLGDALKAINDAIPKTGGLFQNIGEAFGGKKDFTEFASQMSQIAPSLEKFGASIENLKISEGTTEKVKQLGEMMTALQKANTYITGKNKSLNGLIFGIKDLGEAGAQMASAGEGLTAFTRALNNTYIDDTAVQRTEMLGKMMKSLQESNTYIVGAHVDLKGFFGGIKDLGDASQDMVDGVLALQDYCRALNNFVIDDDTVERSNKLGEMMKALQTSNTYTQTHSLDSLLHGMKDISDAADDMVEGVNTMRDYCRAINNFIVDDTAVERTNKIADIMNALGSAKIPTNGLVNIFTGWTDFSHYAKDIQEFIGHFREYVSEIGTLQDGQLEDAGTKTGKVMDVLKAFSNDKNGAFNSGAFANVTSIVDGNVFAGGGPILTLIAQLRDQVLPAINNIGDIDTENFDTVIRAIKRITDLSENFEDFSVPDFSSFSKALSDISEALTTGIADIDTSKVDEFKSAIKKLTGEDMDTSQMDSFAASLQNLAKNGIAEFAKAFDTGGQNMAGVIHIFMDNVTAALTDGSSEEKFATSARNMMAAFASGIQESFTPVQTAMDSVLTAVDSGQFESTGESIGNAFALGINKGTGNARTAAQQLIANAKSVLDAATFNSQGQDAGQTFADGLGSKTEAARTSASNIVSTAANILGRLQGQTPALGQAAGQAFAGGLQGMAGAAYAAGLALSQNAQRGLESGSEYARSSGVHLAQNFAAGIQAGASAAIAAAQSLASQVAAILKHSTPKEGPLRDDDVWGLHLAQNFAQGLVAGMPIVEQSVGNLAQQIKDYLGHTSPSKGPLKDDDEWGKHFTENLANGIKEGSSDVEDEAEDTAAKMAAMLDAILENSRKVLDKFNGDVVKKVDDTGEQVTDIVKDDGNTVVKSFKMAGNDGEDAVKLVNKEIKGDIKDTGDDVKNNVKETANGLVMTTKMAANDGYEAVKLYNKEIEEDVKATNNKLKKNVQDSGKAMVEDAKKVADDVYETVKKAGDKTTQAQEESIKKATDLETNYIKKLEDTISARRALNKMSYSEEAAVWKASLDHVSKDSEAVSQIEEKRTTAQINAWQGRLDETEKFMDLSKKDEYEYWKEIVARTEEGSQAQQEATKKMVEAQKSMWEDYASAIKSDSKSILDTMTSLTDKFELNEESMTYDDLMNSWESAAKAYEAKSNYLNALRKEGVLDDDLLDKFEADDVKNVALLADIANRTKEEREALNEAFEKDQANAMKYSMENAQNLIGKYGDTWTGAFGELAAAFKGGFPTIADLFSSMSSDTIEKGSKKLIGNVIPEKLKEVGVQMVQSAIPELSNVLTTVNDSLSTQLSNMIPDSVTNVLGTILQNVAPNLPGFVEDMKNEVTENAAGIFPDGIKSLLEVISASILEALPDSLPDFFEQFKEILGSVIEDGLADDLTAFAEILGPAVLSALPDFMKSIEEGLGEFFTDYLTENMETVFEWLAELLSDTLPDILPDFFEELADELGDVIGESLTPIIEQMFMADQIKEAILTALQQVFQYATSDPGKKFWQMFFQLGVYLMEGLIAGIKSKQQDVANAVADVVTAAYNAGMAAADAHSPSKKFAKMGGFLGAGLVIGMNDWAGRVSDASSGLIDSASNGVGSLSTMMAQALASDMNQNPTITPVLDLSQVQAQAGLLNSMIPSEQAMAVSAAMDAYGQSGQNGSGNVTNNNDNSVGAINMNVYGAQTQNANDIADEVINRINRTLVRRSKIYA